MRAVPQLPSPLLARRTLLALTIAALPACATSRTGGGVAGSGGADDRGALLARAASASGRASAVSDVSTQYLQGTALSGDPMRPLADVIAIYWRIGARRDPRAVGPTVGEEEVGVYAGPSYLGGWDYLRTVRASQVARVQRLTTSEAYYRYGRQHRSGAVVLTLQPAARP